MNTDKLGTLVCGEGIDQVEVILFADFPAISCEVLLGVRAERIAEVFAADQFQYGFRQTVHIAGVEEPDDGVVKIVGVDLGPRDDYRDALGHEFHDLGAVGFISESVGPFRDDPKPSFDKTSGSPSRAKDADVSI